MAKANQNKDVLEELKAMAEKYGVQGNAMFLAAANQYALQQRVINSIKETLDAEESLMTTKEYVKGRENVYANPLVKELPKHADSANKTAQTILDIIKVFGREKKSSADPLDKFV